MTAPVDPAVLAELDQHIADVAARVDVLTVAWTRMAAENGDSRAVADMAAYLSAWPVEVVASVAAVAVSRVARGGVR